MSNRCHCEVCDVPYDCQDGHTCDPEHLKDIIENMQDEARQANAQAEACAASEWVSIANFTPDPGVTYLVREEVRLIGDTVTRMHEAVFIRETWCRRWDGEKLPGKLTHCAELREPSE